MSADTVTPPPVTPPPTAPVRRRRRWPRRLLPPVALLILAAWFAPAVVVNTGLRNRLARAALADVRGSVEVGGASAGWFAPVELRDVTLKDEAGRTVVSVPKVTSEKSLFELARNRTEPGAFTLDRPTVALVCEATTTNLEAVLAKYLTGDGSPSAPRRTPVAVNVVGGTLALTAAETGKTVTVEDVSATIHVPAGRAEPVTVKVSAATGKLDADVSLGDSGSAHVVCSALPLDTFGPLLPRAAPGLTVAGQLTTDLRITWGTALAVSGTASVTRLALAAPWLNGDTLALDSATLPLDVELAGRVVRVRTFDLACDAGTLSAAGTFDPDQPPETLFAQPGVSVRATVDLARLATKLPKLLRVKDGTEVRDGRLAVTLGSRADGAGVVWEGTVNASALRAVRAGRPVAWEQPLNLEFVGRYASGQLPTLDKLVCTSDFVAVNARVTPETVQAAANVYLHQLGARLTEFVDLDGVALDGEAGAQLVGRREPDGAFRAEASVALKNFAVTDRTGKGLKEPALKLQLAATGRAPAGGPVALATASAALTAGGDELDLTLLEPLADVRKLAGGSVEVRVSGDLARWKARAAAVAAVPPYPVSGTFSVRGRAAFAAERVTVDRLTVGLTNVAFRGAGLNLDEPTVTAVGDLTVTRATGAATVSKLTLTSAPLSVADGTLTFEPLKTDLAIGGGGRCVVDLSRLGATLKLSADPRGTNAVSGRGAGPLRFRYAGDVTTFGGTLDVTNFAYGPRDKPAWAEPTLRVEADGTYTDSADAVALAVAKVERPGLAVDAKGAVAQVTTAGELNLTGAARYDWAKLTPLVRDLLGGNFSATGSGTRAFALNGRLTPPGVPTAAAGPAGGPVVLSAPGAPAPNPAAPTAIPGPLAALSGECALGWDTIKAYGLEVGAGELKGAMAKGVVELAKGPLVERVKLTPQATAGALGYALPAFANAGQADGEVSVTVGENRVPLDDPTRAQAKLTLVVHRAAVGASPVASELAKLLGAANTTMTLASEESVPVQVANGRVSHQNFGFRVGGTTLHTSGSVGFDDTLDLTVDVPLPKTLPALKNNPLLQKAVAGKVVRVPVRGTLAKPAIDVRAFERGVADLVRAATRDVGKAALDKELRKLFPGTPAPKP